MADFPGNGKVQLTGKLGDVLKESVGVALSWVRGHAFDIGITHDATEDIMRNRNIHVHCPAGAVPKVCLTVLVVSACTRDMMKGRERDVVMLLIISSEGHKELTGVVGWTVCRHGSYYRAYLVVYGEGGATHNGHDCISPNYLFHRLGVPEVY